MKEDKSRFEIVLEIAKRAHELEEEARNKELFEKKEDGIKKINDVKTPRNFSLEAYRNFFQTEKEEDK